MNITIISDSIYNSKGAGCNTFAKALSERGHKVSVILPLYEKLYSDSDIKFGIAGSFYVKLPQGNFNINLFKEVRDNIEYYFISNSRLFGREKSWGYHDDHIRTAVLCTAAIETVLRDITDTQYFLTDSPNTALVPVLLKFRYQHNMILKAIKSYHYINYTSYGIYDKSAATTVFGLSADDRHILICNNEINLTKAAIICSSLVFIGENSIDILYDRNNDIHHTAIQFGFKIRKLRLGIDYSIFSPEEDPDIHVPYSCDDLTKKLENKLFVQRYLYLEENENIPLIVLYPDKNIEICRRYMRDLIQCEAQIIVISDLLHRFDNSSLTGKCVCISDKSAETLKNVFSAGDFCLFGGFGSECGNPAFISAAYGCIPILPSHRYFDFGFCYFNKLTLDGNGYTYDPNIQKDLVYTIWDALGVYKHDKKAYKKLLYNTMKKIFPASESIEAIEKEAEKIGYSFIGR